MTPQEAAARLGITEGTLRRRARLPPDHPLHVRRTGTASYALDEPGPGRKAILAEAGFQFNGGGELVEAPNTDPDRDVDTEDLLRRRAEAFARRSGKATRRVHRIERSGPFAVCHMGDPHLDDDGCDWPELLRAVRCVKRTPNMFAGNIGDTVNNWVGRLAEKYKHQSSTERESFQLAKWFIQELPWDYVLLGNHDHWNQGSLLFEEYAKGATIRCLEDHEARIDYVDGDAVFPVSARHDYKGHSMWNKLHGLVRRSKLRPEAQLYLAGHRHTWGAFSEERYDGLPAWAFRLRGYKRHDEYAAAKDFYEDQLGSSITTVFNLRHPHPGERLHAFHDPEEAASFLGWLRSK